MVVVSVYFCAWLLTQVVHFDEAKAVACATASPYGQGTVVQVVVKASKASNGLPKIWYFACFTPIIS
jgi:hypothetical protein